MRKCRSGIPGVGATMLHATRCCIAALHFVLAQEDVQEGPLELYHRLKLYDDTGAANPKKPVRGRVATALCIRAALDMPGTPGGRKRWLY